ncbi:MAG: hypothetical protein KGL15_01685 [Acidobacteriota bacterium]|nr:hypothetical protein [Acidobacteriota bacterium]
MILAALAQHHRGPNGWVLGALLVLAIVYVAWWRGRARGGHGGSRLARLRADLRDQRIGPLTLLPLALLVIVIVVLLVAH